MLAELDAEQILQVKRKSMCLKPLIRTRTGHLDDIGDAETLSSPNGIRTRAATLRGWCPRPLDDGAK